VRNHLSKPILKIISGGQTGAERGALDAAIAAGIRHGGWCPRGRKAGDGEIPAKYRLVETYTSHLWARTEQNVIDSHGTVVFTVGKPTSGPQRTLAFARKYRRPCLQVDLAGVTNEQAALAVLQWLLPGGLLTPFPEYPQPNPVLNVAGSRESEAPGIQERVMETMLIAFDPPFYPTGPE